jgi:hypothetical protein
MSESDIFFIPQDQTVSSDIVVLSEAQRTNGTQFDVVKKHSTQRTYRPTRHSVPSGSNITDHVAKDPILFSILGIITPHSVFSSVRGIAQIGSLGSDAEIAALQDALAEQTVQSAENAQRTRDQFVSFADNFTLLTVVGDDFQHANMIITRVGDPRTPDMGESYELTISMRQIRIARQAARIAPLIASDASKLGGGSILEFDR